MDVEVADFFNVVRREAGNTVTLNVKVTPQNLRHFVKYLGFINEDYPTMTLNLSMQIESVVLEFNLPNTITNRDHVVNEIVRVRAGVDPDFEIDEIEDIYSDAKTPV